MSQTNGHNSNGHNGNGHKPGSDTRRDLFVAEYKLSHNATEAAQKAGYSAHSAYSQGQRLLKNAEIQRRIAEADDQRLKRLELDADYVLRGIRETIERCRQIEPVLDRKGQQVYCETEDGQEVPAFTFNALGALKGYELLGKHLKLFTDKVEHSGAVQVEDSEFTKAVQDHADTFGLPFEVAFKQIRSKIKNPAAIQALDACVLASKKEQ